MITRDFLEKYSVGAGELRSTPRNLPTPRPPRMPTPAVAKVPPSPAPSMPATASPGSAPRPPARSAPPPGPINVNRPANPNPGPASRAASGGGLFAGNPQMLGQVYSALGPAVPALAKYTGGLGLYALNDYLTSGGRNIGAFLPGGG